MEEKRKEEPGGGATFKRLIKYLFHYYKPHLIVVCICIVISACASVVATTFLQQLIDECITPGITSGLASVWSKLISLLTAMAVIYLFGVAAALTYTRLMATVTQGTLKQMRNDMFDRMQTLPVKYFDTHAHGDIMSTYTNDTDAIRQLIGQSLPALVQSLLSILAIVIMMLYYSVWLTIIVGIFIFIMSRVTKKLGGQSAVYMMKQQKTLAKEEGYIEEMMSGQKVIKVFCHEEESKEGFKELNEQLFRDSEKANTMGNILMPALGNIGNLMYVFIAVIGGILVFKKVTNISLTGTAGAGRVFALMDEKPEEDEGYVTLVNAKRNADGELEETEEKTELWAWKHPHKDGTITYTELKGDVRLEHVDFGYVPEKTVLHDVTLYAKPGQKIAFVGATGAGKTTITNLINRFYDIPDGKIRYDGINITKIRKPDLRRSLGVVLQDVNLFTGTVMDNIRYGRLDATDEECIAAAKLANADDFITRLPDGYDTVLTGNGASLSQGQRQLISIARAAVADPPAMILDEATSSIDTRTEALVQEGMDNLMKGRTVFVIAHRLSTVRNSKAIMVLDHGRIIERGDHKELIAQKGTYYQLYTGAFELE